MKNLYINLSSLSLALPRVEGAFPPSRLPQRDDIGPNLGRERERDADLFTASLEQPKSHRANQPSKRELEQELFISGGGGGGGGFDGVCITTRNHQVGAVSL